MASLMNGAAPVQALDQPSPSLMNGGTAPLAPPPTQADAWDANSKAYGDWVAKERADGVAKGLIDPKTGWPTKAGLEDAAHQLAQSVMMGTTAPGAKGARLTETKGAMDEIKHILAQMEQDPHAKWGIRTTEEPHAVGSELPPSRIWDDGDPTEETLPGVSSVGIKSMTEDGIKLALRQSGILPHAKQSDPFYYGQHVHLIKGDSYIAGEDVGEHIIPDAKVMSVYRKTDAGKSALVPIDAPPDAPPAAASKQDQTQ